MSRILIVDDDQALARSLEIQLGTLRHEVRTAYTAADGIGTFGDFDPSIVFLDLNLPDRSGLDVLKEMLARAPHSAILMITGTQDMAATIEAIRAGAFDYIRKPLDIDDITIAIEKADRHVRSLRSSSTAAPATPDVPPLRPREIVGRSGAIMNVIKSVGLVSRSRVTVLIEGESGTGKELVARAIHDAGTSGDPFVAINCSAIVPTLLESELFGHEKGAFTGADATKIGKLELAGSGTVFLDEVGDLAIDVQGKLLRAIQEREFERVGGVNAIPLGARIVAATHRDLEALVRDGAFREDLYFRLAVTRIPIPPLRERREDIALITDTLLGRIVGDLETAASGKTAHTLSEGAREKLQSHDWPGNVRELENALTRAIAMSRATTIEAEAISFDAPARSGVVGPLHEAEREHVRRALESMGWNITRTAKRLEISQTTLRKKISDYGLER